MIKSYVFINIKRMLYCIKYYLIKTVNITSFVFLFLSCRNIDI